MDTGSGSMPLFVLYWTMQAYQKRKYPSDHVLITDEEAVVA
jgi:hypothetical protein